MIIVFKTDGSAQMPTAHVNNFGYIPEVLLKFCEQTPRKVWRDGEMGYDSQTGNEIMVGFFASPMHNIDSTLSRSDSRSASIIIITGA